LYRSLRDAREDGGRTSGSDFHGLERLLANRVVGEAKSRHDGDVELLDGVINGVSRHVTVAVISDVITDDVSRVTSQ